MQTFAEIPNTKLIRGAAASSFSSMLRALEYAYDKHYDIAISPDHVWFTLLCEIATLVKEDPAKWAHLFTTTPGKKQEIVVLADDPELIRVDWIIEALRGVIPSNVASFFPQFSTTDEQARMACNVAFADVVSPFYEYWMLSCRTPEVYVLGPDEDWKELEKTIVAVIGDIFGDHHWCDRIRGALYQMYLGEPIFGLKKCGSGHETEVTGEWIKMFRKVPPVRFIQNYPTGIAQMEYRDKTTERSFLLQAGLFEEHLDTTEEIPILTPHFGYRLLETFKENK